MGENAAKREKSRWGRLALLGAAAALCAGVVVAIGGTDGATGKKPSVLEGGGQNPNPSCPKSPCEAIGSVTGFQVRANKVRNPFRMPSNGDIVAWSVDLSKPTSSQRNFFGKLFRDDSFGRNPSARISVLRDTNTKNTFKLSKKSPPIDLSDHYGETPLFTLDKPITAKKGTTIALTIPTWLPNFATPLSAKNKWRASRDKCGANAAADASPQEKLGSKRLYRCQFNQARLLYKVYYVKGSGGSRQVLSAGE